MALSAKNRAEIVGLIAREAQVSQYAELTEDELIELASDLTEAVLASERRATLELVAVLGALKARREATAPARRRIGEYLRQQCIVEAKYEQDMASGSDYAKRNAKPVLEVLDEVRSDLYAGTARLRFADLRQLVTPVVRDTKVEFDAEQQRRLELWQAEKLPEKQAALLECIAQGHMSVYVSMGNRSYSGEDRGTWRDEERCKKCKRPDGRTMQALERKGVVTRITPLGYSAGGSRYTLMLTDPEKTSK